MSVGGHLFMVADGMGAHAAGELASAIAVDTVPLVYQKYGELPPDQALRRAVQAANDEIYHRGCSSPDFRGMGTTGSALVILPEGAIVAHVGDSRVYRLRGERFEQLTFDHSLAWEMQASADRNKQSLSDYVPKNIITRSLGPNADVEVDLEGPIPIESGDTFLLCSDGLSGPVRDDEMGTIISCMPPEDAAQALVDLANLRGGPDNVTVIVARVKGPQVAKKPSKALRAEQTASDKNVGEGQGGESSVDFPSRTGTHFALAFYCCIGDHDRGRFCVQLGCRRRDLWLGCDGGYLDHQRDCWCQALDSTASQLDLTRPRALSELSM